MKPFENALPGFNHNIKHKGQLFHIQTEDSGRHNPTVTTLLFLGGNIVASLKASYAEHLEAEELSKRVRELMEAQHKQMLRNLLKGQYDNKSELQPKHWQVGQLDENNHEETTHPSYVPLETEGRLTATPALGLHPQGRQSRPLPVVPPTYTATTLPPEEDRGPRPHQGLQSRPSRPLPVLPQPTQAFEDEATGAVFGEDLISEKRLDELILNYLFREKDKPS